MRLRNHLISHLFYIIWVCLLKLTHEDAFNIFSSLFSKASTFRVSAWRWIKISLTHSSTYLLYERRFQVSTHPLERKNLINICFKRWEKKYQPAISSSRHFLYSTSQFPSFFIQYKSLKTFPCLVWALVSEKSSKKMPSIKWGERRTRAESKNVRSTMIFYEPCVKVEKESY